MPFKNYYSARQTEPNYKEYAYSKDKLGDGIDAVFGIKDGKTELQAIRFKKDKFTTEKAKEWLERNKFKNIVEELSEADFSTVAPTSIATGQVPQYSGLVRRNFTDKIKNYLKDY